VKNHVADWNFQDIIHVWYAINNVSVIMTDIFSSNYLESFLSIKSTIELSETIKRRTISRQPAFKTNSDMKGYLANVVSFTEEAHRVNCALNFLYPPNSDKSQPLALELVKFGRSELRAFIERRHVKDYQDIFE
jgi:hypothetical protein